MLDGGTNCGKGEQLWQPYMVRGTIVGAVFGPAGPLAARTTYGVTGSLATTLIRLATHAGMNAYIHKNYTPASSSCLYIHKNTKSC